MEKTMRLISALFLTLIATTAVGGEVYTWKDASGKVHYSDTPPADSDAKKMRAGSSAEVPAVSAPVAKKSLAEQELDFRKRKTEGEEARAKAEKEKTEAEEKSKNCEQAKLQLQALESGQRIARYNAQGERVALDDDGRAQEIVAARKAVQNCSK